MECFGKDGLANKNIYAGGWSANDKTKLFYINSSETSEELVERIISSIFDNKDLNNYTFFAHNLGRFDSVFILKSTGLRKEYKIDSIWKDNEIISITVKNNKLKFKITFLDSLHFIKSSLEEIL